MKLVRDKIVSIIKKSGRNPEYKVMNDLEYENALKDKLIEESIEIKESKSKEELLSELADLQEVVDTLSKYNKFTKRDIKKKQKEKNRRNGSFKKKIMLINKG